MARLVTLAKIRGLARLYADQRPGGANAFVPDNDGGAQSVGAVNDLINLAIAELWDLLVAARSPEFTAYWMPFDTVPGQSVYEITSPIFYQALDLIFKWGPNNQESVSSIDRAIDKTPLVNYGVWAPWAWKSFRVSNSTLYAAGALEIFPTPTTVVSAELWYVPTAPVLTADIDTVDCWNGWEKLVALRVAMELRTIEEVPYGDLERLYEREKERVVEMASERQALTPKQVRDVQPEGGGGWQFVRRRDP